MAYLQQTMTLLQGHCLRGKFDCLSCTCNHSAFEGTPTLELYLKAAAKLGSAWDSEAEFPAKAQTLLALCDPYLPEPVVVLEPHGSCMESWPCA